MTLPSTRSQPESSENGCQTAGGVSSELGGGAEGPPPEEDPGDRDARRAATDSAEVCCISLPFTA